MERNGNGRGESFAVCEEMSISRLTDLVEQGELTPEHRVLVMRPEHSTIGHIRRAKLEEAYIAHGSIRWRTVSA